MDFQHGKPREGSLGRATETRPKGLGPWVWDSRPAVSGGAALGPEMGWDQSAPFPIGGDPDATIPYCTEPTTVAPGDLSALSASDAGVRKGASGRRVTFRSTFSVYFKPEMCQSCKCNSIIVKVKMTTSWSHWRISSLLQCDCD